MLMKIPEWLTFRTIWLGVLLATSTCAVVVLGWTTADARTQHVEQEMRLNLLHRATEVASSVNPNHVATLTFDSADHERSAYQHLCEQFRVYSIDSPVSGIHGVAERDGVLVYGPSHVVGDPAAHEPGAPYLLPREALGEALAAGRRFVESLSETAMSATAPVFDPNTGRVLMTVVLDVPMTQWRAELFRTRVVPMAWALVVILVQFIGVGLIYLRDKHARDRNRLRHLETVLVAVAFSLLTCIAVFFVLESEDRERRLQFMETARAKAHDVESRLRSVQQRAHNLGAYVAAAVPLSEESFQAFARPLVANPAVDKCFWIAGLTADERAVMEEQLRVEGHGDYQWHRLDAAGEPAPINEDEEILYPVYYVMSGEEGIIAPGLDMSTLPKDRVAIQSAVRTGMVTAAAPVADMAMTAPDAGVRLYVPVYARGASGTREVVGIIGIQLRFDWVLYDVLADAGHEMPYIILDLYQMVANAPPIPVAEAFGDDYISPPRRWGIARIRDIELEPLMHPMFVFSHTYALLIEPTESFMAANPMRNTYATGIVSVFFTIVLTLCVGVLRNHQVDLERKVSQSVSELREQSVTFRRLFMESNDPTLLLKTNRIVDCNVSTLRLLKYNSRQKLLNRRPEDISPAKQPDGQPSAERFREMVAMCVRNGHHAFEWTHLRSDGTPVPVEAMFTYITLRGANHIHVTWRDITQRKQAEEALKSSEEKYRTLVDSLPIGLYRYTPAPEERFVMVNKAMVRIAGFDSMEELMSKSIKNLYADVEEREALWRKLDEDGFVAGYEIQLVRKDGAVIWGSISCRSIRNKDGEVEYFDGSVMDITERKRADEERIEMERRLLHSQKLESLGVLAGGIAHDFNNLLAVVLGNLEVATDDIDTASPAHGCMRKAVSAARRAAALTDQMLAYSGKGRFIVKPMDLSVEVEENLHILRASISKNVALDLHLEEDLPPIYADEGQIQQVVMNLITNASEAIGEAEGAIAIKTGVTHCTAQDLARSQLEEKPEPGDFIFLEIRDTGCGMDKETIKRAFDPFFSTKFTGRGLGMSAVLGIMQAHKGALEIESAPGEGARIRVLFPVAEPPEDLPMAEAYEPETPEPSKKKGLDKWSGTFLVVDDEAPLRELGQKVLNRFGFDTIVACDGQEAVEIFEEKADEIVAVLLDLTMPRMDGVAAFQAMREIRPDVKVILCSGFSENEAMQRFPGQKLAGYVHKPYRITTLRSEIEKIMKDA